jgi:hypothetical protein
MLNSNDPRSAQLRSLVSWALLAYVAVSLFFTFLSWLIPASDIDKFTSRSEGSVGSFLSLFTAGLVVLAIVLAVGLHPPAAMSRLMAMVALAELAFMVVLGLIAWLIGFGTAFDDTAYNNGTLDGLRYLVLNPIAVIIIALAAFWVMRVAGLGDRLPTIQRRPATPAGPTYPPADNPPPTA